MALTLLADNDLSHPGIRGAGVINLIPVNKHDEVCILLQRTGVTQVTIIGAFIGPLLHKAVELGKRQYRTAQLFTERLKRAGNFRYFLRAVFLLGERTSCR